MEEYTHKTTNKTETLFVRVTPAVAERLRLVAEANDRKPSEELRAALLEHLDKQARKHAVTA